KFGPVLVALAGPAANIAIAVLMAIVLRFVPVSLGFFALGGAVVYINILLAVFNLIPIPPLDGHYVLFALLPARLQHVRFFLSRYGFILLLVVIFLLWKFIQPIVDFLYTVLVS